MGGLKPRKDSIVDERLNALMQAQQARRETEEVIAAVSGQSGQSGQAHRGTYLVSGFETRSDLPASASLRRMTSGVACQLAEMGWLEPVSLQAMPPSWWTVKIDAAEVGVLSEYGCALVTRTLSSSKLADIGFEVVGGPFRDWENDEVSRCILTSHPGKFWDARAYAFPSAESGQKSLPFSGSDNAFTSEQLLMALNAGHPIQVFSGPYQTQEDAHYALDIRWEVPD